MSFDEFCNHVAAVAMVDHSQLSAATRLDAGFSTQLADQCRGEHEASSDMDVVAIIDHGCPWATMTEGVSLEAAG